MSLRFLNGTILLDNSAIERWRCPQEFDLSVNQQRALVAARAGRNFGSACHEGWAVRYALRGTQQVDGPTVDAINNAMKLWFDAHPEPSGDFRNYQHAVRYMAEYNRVYQTEPYSILVQPAHCKQPGKPLIEEGFMLPFAIAGYQHGQWTVVPWHEPTYQGWRVQPSPNIVPIFYTGKIDLGIQNNNGIFSFDHKTAFQFGKDWEAGMLMDGAQRGYCWALGKIMGTKATGYIIDGCRVRRPSRKEEYEGQASIDPSDFMRIPVWLDQSQLDEWEQDVRNIIQSILTANTLNQWPRHRWECVRKFGKCDFYEICSGQAATRQWQLYDSGQYEHNDWSPLRKTTENKANEQQNTKSTN